MRFTKTDLNKTLWVKPAQMDKERERYHSSAEGKTLWRLAVDIAMKLQGKNKAHYCDFWDAGDFVVITDAEKIGTTGYKDNQKIYYRYSGWKGNVKSRTLKEMREKDPTKILWFAVRGMLPKNKLRQKRMKRLKLFVGSAHKYANVEMKAL